MGDDAIPRKIRSSAVSVAWLDPRISSEQAMAEEEAWELLAVHDELREWLLSHLFPVAPSLQLHVRPQIDRSRIRKTPKGVTMQIPSSWLHDAGSRPQLVRVYADAILAIYAKWASDSGSPPPPDIPL